MMINPAPHTVGQHSSKAVLNENWRQVSVALGSILTPVIQAVTTSNDTIDAETDVLAVNRSAPSTTGLTLPDASLREGRPLLVLDYSQSVTDHAITLTPFSAGQKVMRQSTWPLSSNSVSLASVKLVPIVDPDNAANYVWIIAP